MTIEEQLIEMLGENGMWDTQAKEVLIRVKADEKNKPLAQRWKEPSGDYPEVLINAIWLNTKHHALEWIDANIPQAWYRQMFVEENEHEI